MCPLSGYRSATNTCAYTTSVTATFQHIERPGAVKKARPKMPENSFPCENEIRRVLAFCCAAFGTFRVRVLHFFRSSDLLEQFRYAYTQTNTSTHAVTHRLTVLLNVCCFQIYYSLGRFFLAGCRGEWEGVIWVARGEGWMDFVTPLTQICTGL